MLCCICGVLGHGTPGRPCACPVCCLVCAVFLITWLLCTGVHARCAVLCCACGVLGHLAPVHRYARSLCCIACAASWATWLLFTGVHARCVVLCRRCPGSLGPCSRVCTPGVLCCACGVLGHLAPVHRCAPSVHCVACVVSWAPWVLFTGLHARSVVLCVRYPGPVGSCSSVCTLVALCSVCGVPGDLALVHWGAPPVCCVARAVSLSSELLFTGVHARCAILRVRRPGPLSSCSPVCTLVVLYCMCGVLGHLAPVHRCPCSVCCVVSAVSRVTWLLFTG